MGNARKEIERKASRALTLVEKTVRLFGVLPRLIAVKATQQGKGVLHGTPLNVTYAIFLPFTVMSGSRRANGLISFDLRFARLWLTKRCVLSSLRTA